MSNNDQPIRIEIFSHEAEQRLREEMKQMDQQHRAELERLDRRYQGLQRTLYEVIETLGNLRRKS